jgi:hypothetical protein
VNISEELEIKSKGKTVVSFRMNYGTFLEELKS